jgi:cobalt-zinc-cadmium efflux system outer membrane protein
MRLTTGTDERSSLERSVQFIRGAFPARPIRSEALAYPLYTASIRRVVHRMELFPVTLDRWKKDWSHLTCCWLLLIAVTGGCSSSRWGVHRKTARVTNEDLQEDRDDFQKRGSAKGASKTKPVAAARVRVEKEFAETFAAEMSVPAGPSADSKLNSIRQVGGTSDPDSLAQIVESNFAVTPTRTGDPRSPASTRLQIPKELPGAEAPTVDLPPHDSDDAVGRARDIARNFADLPTVPGTQVNTTGSDRTYTLNELQAVALSSNPLMAQAEAHVVTTRGTAIQAGLHPNPIIGYEADTVNSNANPNYQGGFINTLIKTAGKLELAQSAATVDVWNADLMKQKARVELITQVRGAYFAALIARENVKVTEALVRFTDSVYQIQLDQLRGGLVSVYEPIQLRALAMQARTALTQARNRYDAAWRQLAATVGNPEMPIGELEGSPDMIIPAIDYNAALPYVLANHTDVLAARNSETQARINLRLQEVTPIPDIVFYTALQKDYTTAPIYRLTYNMQVGVPVPIFDKNQGNILNAHGTLMKASQEAARVQNDLATRLSDAVERYANASNIVHMYRDHVLPDQARAYRGVYERHQQQPDIVGFADVVTAQQTLLMSIGTYINSLAARWLAFTDIGALIQAETLDEIENVIREGGGATPAEVRDESIPIVPPGPIGDTE